MERTINIGGVDVRMRASALIPRMYRFSFGRDLIKDMTQLEGRYRAALELEKKEDATDEEKKQAQLSVVDLTIFENVAWCMAKAADKSIPDSPDDWLDTMDGMFPIYEVLPQILDLWLAGLEQTSSPAKK